MGTAFEKITRGLNEAICHAKGEKVAIKTYTPKEIDVSALRRDMGMTQQTLRHWERGDRTPQGASLVFLNVIKRNPNAVQAALS
ncbi:MAG: hypothetical protein RL358_495 [Pseudomonadota bacterium]